MDTTNSDAPMPCHATVDYSDPDWRDQLETDAVAYCVGAAIFLRNQLKLPMLRSRARFVADRKTIFANRAEFLAHHSDTP